MNMIGDRIKFLRLLSEKYPTRQQVCTEIINLQAILNLPKGTEHFMSDLHGEYEAFKHILNNSAGVIREKVDMLFSETLTPMERSSLCTLIYYPEEKLKKIREEGRSSEEWYRFVLQSLIDLAKLLSSKYTRSKVRKAMPPAYSYILDELLHAQRDEDDNQLLYHQKIIDTLLKLEEGDDFIIALSSLIKRLAVDHLHIVGDIFDRGERPDAILNMLMEHHSLDIEWGNHDILWMGAACGSQACIAAVVRNCLSYNNISVLEQGYGISLRPLVLFAEKTYPAKDVTQAAKMAISIILFKLEGRIIRRNPDFGMEDRLLLDKVDFDSATIELSGKVYPLKEKAFPTVDRDDPYKLSEAEREIMDELEKLFLESEQLQRHVTFLYNNGSMYRKFNGNLLFHGCVPLDEDGNLKAVQLGGRIYQGKSYMDYADMTARRAFFSEEPAAGISGLYVVLMVRQQLAAVRTGGQDLRAHLHRGQIHLDRAAEPLLPLSKFRAGLPDAAAGVWALLRERPHHQRPHPHSRQGGGESAQGARQADCHRRRLLQGLPKDDRHRGLHPDL